MVKLRPFNQSDFPRLIGWIDCLETLVQWAGPVQFKYPLSVDQLKTYLAQSEEMKPARKVFTALDEQGGVCGHIEIAAIDYDNQTGVMSRVFIAPEARGRGLCLPMVKELLKVGFEELGLRRIELRVYSFNSSAIRCYERAGFVKEGLLRKVYKAKDGCWDSIIMAILREEWDAAR